VVSTLVAIGIVVIAILAANRIGPDPKDVVEPPKARTHQVSEVLDGR
jgi:hypothetical protein